MFKQCTTLAMYLQLQHTLKASWITHFEGFIENVQSNGKPMI